MKNEETTSHRMSLKLTRDENERGTFSLSLEEFCYLSLSSLYSIVLLKLNLRSPNY